LIRQPLGVLPQRPLFWDIDTFPTRSAAEAEKGARGSVVEAFGKVWLLTIAEQGWRAQGGERVAEIGPIPLQQATGFTAMYMEVTFAGRLGRTAQAFRSEVVVHPERRTMPGNAKR
jgi:hypothetical protein